MDLKRKTMCAYFVNGDQIDAEDLILIYYYSTNKPNLILDRSQWLLLYQF